MQTPELAAVLAVCQAILRVAAERVLTIMGMVICAVLFGWVLYAPDWIRVAAACGFAVLVYWPIVRLERSRKGGEAQ